MLKEHNVEFEYRQYKRNPLSLAELQELMAVYGQPASTLLRRREKAYRELNLTGNEADEVLLPLFVQHPALMQRPIFVHEGRAVLGRPVERLLELL